jgi:hypothetical protein
VSSITAGKQGQGKAPLLIAAGAALALLIGVGTWQITDRDDDAATTGTVSTAVEQPVSTGTVASDVPAPAEPAAAYIVATEEEANRLRLAIADSDAIRDHMGLPAMDTAVLVAATPDEYDQVMRLVAEINADRDAEGWSTYRVHDLRNQGSTAASPPDSGDYDPAADPWVGP